MDYAVLLEWIHKLSGKSAHEPNLLTFDHKTQFAVQGQHAGVGKIVDRAQPRIAKMAA